MEIYFAGSIRGGRDNKHLYSQIIELLKQFGTVITEHVGSQNLSANGEFKIRDKDIYKRDISLLFKADVLVAEVTTPSLGVGYEIGKAEDMKKPILCLFNNKTGVRLSAMIAGNKNMLVKSYESIKDIRNIIKNFLK